MNALPDHRLSETIYKAASVLPDVPDGMDLGEMISTLWRGKWWIAGFGLFTAILAFIWAIGLAQPRYQATAVIVLDGGREPVVDFTDFLPMMSGDATIVNTELEVLRSVSLLAAVVASEGLTEDPEFNTTLQSESLLKTATRQLKSLLHLPAEAPPSATVSERRAHNATVEALGRALTVRNVPDSMVFEITFETSSPDKSAHLADVLVEKYLDQQLETKFEATQRATEWLSEKVAVLETELEAAEAETNRFAAQMELISAETLDILSQQLKEVRDRITAREAAVTRGDRDANSARRIAQLQTLEAELSDKIARQSRDLVTLEQLEREAAANRQIYEYFLGRLKETSIQEGIQQADARLMSAAMIPDIPTSPKPLLAAILGGIGGLCLAVVMILAQEARTATFRTADALERVTGLPVLGQIPQIPARRRHGVLHYIRTKPNSAAVESIRNLRTSLLMSDKRQPPKVILSTSSLPGEGKTTQTLTLAQNMTGVRNRVLVIEGDVRKRVFKDYFGANEASNLIDVLSGQIRLQDAVWHSDDLGFDILFGADAPANAADIFSGQAFRRLIRQARKEYDIVLIDTPPVLLVPDARVIGQLADAVLYTVRWDKTREKQVLQGIRAFQTVGVPVTGLVLGQINARGMKRYGYGQDYGTYGSSGYYQN